MLERIAKLEHIKNNPYRDLLIDNTITAKRYIPDISEPDKTSYNLACFSEDNQKITHWFAKICELFYATETEAWNKNKIQVTGSRSFRASYIESDLECAVVSENFEDFLKFCAFLFRRYQSTDINISVLTTTAGLPLLVLKKREDKFDCSLLNAEYPNNSLPQLEITFRTPQIHHLIQTAGNKYFQNLTEEQFENYIYNKRRLRLIKNAISTEQTYNGIPIISIITELTQAIQSPMLILKANQLNMPDFSFDILEAYINTSNYNNFHHRIRDEIILEAQYLQNVLKNANAPKEQTDLLKKIFSGNRLPPDDWALGQELFEPESPYFTFFKHNRDALSNQLKVNNKYLTSVPIITFHYKNELYVLLMQNIGLKNSSDVQEIEWTAHGARVDANEDKILNNRQVWALLNTVNQGDESASYLLAAAIRRIKGMGINITDDIIKNIHPINRDAAGFPEENKHYQTAFFHIELGEVRPEVLTKTCKETSSSRYGHWTHCFKVKDLLLQTNEMQHPTKSRETYQLSYNEQSLTVRITTMRFIMALNLMCKIANDISVKSPWDIHDPSTLERALNWISNREDGQVQFSLFHPNVIYLDSAKIHAFAQKAKMNPENLAYLTIKPKRLLLHHLIAQLTVKVKIKNKKHLETLLDYCTEEYEKKHPNQLDEYENLFQVFFKEYKNTNKENEHHKRINELLPTISHNSLSDIHKAIYHLQESDLEIATIIATYEKYSEVVNNLIMQEVNNIINTCIKNKALTALETVQVEYQQFFGVTGPVASGKSVSECIVRNELNNKGAAFISSDEWNDILSKIMDLSNHQKHKGKLTLAEAWFIKKLIWRLIDQLAKQSKAINVIQEAMDPSSLRIPLTGKASVFLNTASPAPAINRVQTRGNLSGRYVSGASTFSSYRWPWLSLLSFIKKQDFHKVSLSLKIIDTDAYNAYGRDRNAIKKSLVAEINENKLIIHNLARMISMINRSYMINPAPKNQMDRWQLSNMELSAVAQAIKDLFLHAENKLNIIYKDQLMNTDKLFSIITNIVNSTKKLQQFFQKNVQTRRKNMPNLSQMIEQLSEENKQLLSLYGNLESTPADRVKLSITGLDEFSAISTSLYLLLIFLKNESMQDIKLMVSQAYEETGFHFPGISYSDEKVFEQNISAICTLRDNARKNFGDNVLIKMFLLHDLGKIKAFITENNLANGSLSAANHDLYLMSWLNAQPEVLTQFESLTSWVNIFDGLGYNPQKLSEPGYCGILNMVKTHIDMLKQLNIDCTNNLSNNILTFNAYLYQKAKTLGLSSTDFSFLVSSDTHCICWKDLPIEQQQKITMLLWCCPFIFVKPPLETNTVTQEFVKLWSNSKHNNVVTNMTNFMMENIFASDDSFIFLYNLTGLIHHKAEQGGSHFANGGTVKQIFTVLFPFILEIVSQHSERIVIENTAERSINPFQMLQGVETHIQMFELLAKNKTPSWSAVNFASPECKAIYLQRISNCKIEPQKTVIECQQRLFSTEQSEPSSDSDVKSNVETSYKR